MTIWTIRHPPVDRQGRCVGQTQIETTISVAEAVEQVVERAPFVPARLYSSDLPRCSRLASGLATRWGLSLDTTPDLREMNFGEWEGRSYDEIDASDGDRWRAWCADWRNQSPPDGESIDDMIHRISTWVRRCSPSQNDLLVTHAGVIRALRVLSGQTWDQAIAASCPYLEWMEHHLKG